MKLAWIAYLSIIPCFAYAANESEPALNSHHPNLFDTSRDDERNYLAAAKGKAERKGDTLYLWKDGYGPQEQGLLFHDWSIKGGPNSDDNGNSFLYLGGDKKYQLVLENFMHDSPMLYVIAENGQELRLHILDIKQQTPDEISLTSEQLALSKKGEKNSIESSRLHFKDGNWHIDAPITP